MKYGIRNDKNLRKTVKSFRQMTHNIDNCSFKYKYVNNQINLAENTRQGLYLFENPLLDNDHYNLYEEVLPLEMTYELKELYYYNPRRVSHDYLGDSSYWYLILSLNGFLSIDDFHSFEKIYIPDKSIIEKNIKKYDKIGGFRSYEN